LTATQDTVKKPVFVLGSPRSGTTLLYETLCNHKDLAYVTFNVLRSRVHKLPPPMAKTLFKVYSLLRRDPVSLAPHEANNFWIKHFGSYRYLTEGDYIPEMSDYYKRNILTVQEMGKRPRFINKNMQNCVRVRLLHKIFPDAKFIHIIRDGRAVAFSILKKREKEGISTVFLDNLERVLDGKYRSDRSPLFNYGLGWAELVKRAREASDFGTDRYYEIRYENLVANTHQEVKKIAEFCELEWYDGFERSIPATTDMNVKWKQRATDEQQADLEESTLEMRRAFGMD
jgi:hypothetical protein